jgi:hypothetical protein
VLPFNLLWGSSHVAPPAVFATDVCPCCCAPPSQGVATRRRLQLREWLLALLRTQPFPEHVACHPHLPALLEHYAASCITGMCSRCPLAAHMSPGPKSIDPTIIPPASSHRSSRCLARPGSMSAAAPRAAVPGLPLGCARPPAAPHPLQPLAPPCALPHTWQQAASAGGPSSGSLVAWPLPAPATSPDTHRWV